MSETLAAQIAERYGRADEADGIAGAAVVPGADGLARVLSHRTIRRYTDQPVPEPLLRTLLAAAQSAPTKSDLQQYSIVVVEDAAARGEIAGWLPAMPWVGQAPLFLLFCGDMRRAQRVCELRGRPHANDNLDSFLNCAVDAGLVLGAFIHAAEAAGLGCCPISHVRNHLPRLSELLALPPGVFPVCGLTVGWPADPGRMSMRLPQAAVVHRDRYDDRALAEAVDDYDRRRHAREPIPAEKQKNADVYGTTDYCPWSDQLSRQLSRPERADLAAFLRRHGFSLA